MPDPSAMAFAVREGGGCTVASSIMLSQIRLPSPDMIVEGKRKGEPKMAIVGWLVISGI